VRLVAIEEQRTEAGVDPLSSLLQAKLTAAQLKLSRLHLETRSATLAKQLATLTGLPVGSITPDHASIPEIPAVSATKRQSPAQHWAANALARSKLLEAKGPSWRGAALRSDSAPSI
jgi:outer membrane protein, adhesin transport system